MASTSQISNSMHANRRRNSAVLMGCMLVGVSLVVIPGVYFVCQNTAQRSDLCQNISDKFKAGIGTAGLGSLFQKKTPIATASAGSSMSPIAPAVMSKKMGVTASNVKLVDEAVKLLQTQIDSNPKDASLHNRLGLIYAELGELSQAETQFKQAIEIARVGLTDSRAAVEANKTSGQFALASEQMLKGSQSELELSTAHSNLARVYEKLGQQSKVVAQLDQLNHDVRINGNLAQSLGLSTSAVAAKSGNKNSVEIVDGMAKAEALLQAHMLPQAMAQLKHVLTIDPTIAEAHEKLGRAALATGNIFLATQELKQAVQSQPGKAATHASLGICYQCASKNKEAVDEFNKALAIDPKDALTAFNLGNAYAALNQNSDARRFYLQAIALKPDMAVAHNNLATVLSIAGQYDQAIEQFEHTISLAPNMASAHYGLGLARFNKQDFANASREFKIALQLNPNLIDAHTKIEMCYRHNSQNSSMNSNIASGINSSGIRHRAASIDSYDSARPRLSMTTVSGDAPVRARQARKVTMSSSIDEGGNRSLAQRLN